MTNVNDMIRECIKIKEYGGQKVDNPYVAYMEIGKELEPGGVYLLSLNTKLVNVGVNELCQKMTDLDDKETVNKALRLLITKNAKMCMLLVPKHGVGYIDEKDLKSMYNLKDAMEIMGVNMIDCIAMNEETPYESLAEGDLL